MKNLGPQRDQLSKFFLDRETLPSSKFHSLARFQNEKSARDDYESVNRYIAYFAARAYLARADSRSTIPDIELENIIDQFAVRLTDYYGPRETIYRYSHDTGRLHEVDMDFNHPHEAPIPPNEFSSNSFDMFCAEFILSSTRLEERFKHEFRFKPLGFVKSPGYLLKLQNREAQQAVLKDARDFPFFHTAIGLFARDLISTERYDTLTGTWRTQVGSLHPLDPELEKPKWQSARDGADSSYPPKN